MNRYIAFIPVRGGSKGIPKKNIKLFCGKPLLQYVADAAANVKKIDKIIISTESEEIREVVKKHLSHISNLVLFDRDPATATDEASTESAMLNFAQKTNLEFEHIILIQATSPLLDSIHLEEGIEQYEKNNLGGLVSVVEQNRFIWSENQPFNYTPSNRERRQNSKGHFVENGAFYITSKADLLKNECRISEPYGVYKMPRDSYHEIDDPTDWETVEGLLAKKKLQASQNQLPKNIKAVVLDFDGVFTDNKVIVHQNEDESVVCSRGDGMGISMIKEKNIDVWVLSKEVNPVLKSRCKKLGIPCIHGLNDKWPLLEQQLAEKKYSHRDVIYVGNDINDIECMIHVGCGVAVSDAHPEVLKIADCILTKKGGNGAIRELCDMILKSNYKQKKDR